MKRSLALAVAMSALVLMALPAGAAAPTTSYALEGEARGLELSLGDQGLTLGVALSRADSTPKALGVGAGQCSVLGQSPDPDQLPCNESTMQKSSAPNDESEPGETCASPSLPPQLASVLTVDLACGSSASALTKAGPTTINSGEVGEVALELDLRGLIPQAEDAKEQLVDQLQQVIGGAPEPIKNALNSLLDTIDEGQAGQILMGPAGSNVSAKAGKLTVSSSSGGALIGVAGIPDLDEDGVPIPGSSNATEDGLIIIEVGRSNATASLNKTTAAADSAATAALVTVKVRDITKVEPTYQEISVAPGQTVTILEGTPAESTITAASATEEAKNGSALAAADAVRLHLLKGVSGGLKLGLARATAAASVQMEPLVRAQQPPNAKVLPQTGARDVTLIAVGLLLLAGVALAVRRRVS